MKTNSQPKVAIVILNYNTQALLQKYLPSVVKTSYANTEIWVIDNASVDNSADFVRKQYPEMKVLETQQNLGYAGGYNWALKQIEADYYVLLNSDVEVDANWLNPLVELAESDIQIGAIQPKILDAKDRSTFEYAGASGGFLDRWGYPFCRGRIFNVLERDEGQYNDVVKVFWATGACMFVRAKTFREANGLDGDFFAHMEEIDLCWRMQLQGNTVYVNPNSKVYHLGGGTLAEGSEMKYFLNFRNNLFLLAKNDQSSLWFFRLFVRMILDGISAIKFVMDGKPKLLLIILKAHFAFYKSLPQVLKKRKEIKLTVKPNQLSLYSKSIVWQHFGKKINRFTDL
jgi:GT2 family glycosyltransferase